MQALADLLLDAVNAAMVDNAHAEATMSGKIAVEDLRSKASVHVRQSTPGQVSGNLESQRCQYALQDTARALGFTSGPLE